MHKKVAVEKNLEDVKEYFQHKDFQVDSFADYELYTIGHVSPYDAIIISGTSKNYGGQGSKYETIPVINSKGLTPEDVFNKLN